VHLYASGLAPDFLRRSLRTFLPLPPRGVLGLQGETSMASDFRLKEQLPRLTDRIVKTYSEVGKINHLGHCPLPRYDVIVSAIADLKDVIFPGYRRREGLHLGNVTYHVGDLIDGLHDKLTTQIGRALMHEGRLSGNTDTWIDRVDYDARGQAMTIDFLERIPDLRRILATDVQAAFNGDPACTSTDEVVFCYPGLEAITVHRLAHELQKLGVPFIPRMMAEWAHKETGIDIHPGARIGPHFFIDHGTGVVIGETCDIGEHVKIYQGVTLGALSFPTDASGNIIRGAKRHPTIGDRVVIYASATILGGKTVIGHDSVIGSSVWLTHSVEPRTTVTMEKPKLRIRAELPEELAPELNYVI
jgi:serine O-acetyltransferase